MKIIVIGSSGQLAQSLLERSAQFPNLETIALARPQIDLTKVNSAAAAIKDLAPDLVINAAAYTLVDQAEDQAELAFRINADAAGEIAAAAGEIGAAIVHISTDYVFDGTLRAAYTEQAAVNPLGVYGRSKLAGEEQVRTANPRHAIVRTAWVYSPFGRNFLKSMMAAAQTRDRLNVVNDQRGSPTSALDLAEALLTIASADHGWGETFHVAGRGAATWYEFAEQIMRDCAAFNLPHVPVIPITTEQWPTRAVRPANSVLDSSKFEHAFGIGLPAWQASTRDVVKRLAEV